MLTEDPDGYLDKAATLDRIGSRQQDKLRQLQSAQRALEAAALPRPPAKLDRLERQRAELKRQKKAVQKKLAAARRLLDELSPAETRSDA